MFKDIPANRIILWLFYLFLLTGLTGIYFVPKPGLFLSLYSCHTVFLNDLMKFLTLLGTGVAALVAVILVLFWKIRHGFSMALSTGISGLVTQALKIFVFPGHYRPVKYLGDMGITLDTVPGVHIHFYHSFPSGHTTTAFALWFGLSLIVRNMTLKVFLFILAIAVGYSRIYLGQHFPEDVIGGAVVGGLSAVLFIKMTDSWEKEWLNSSLITLIR